MDSTTELARLIEPVALAIWGKPSSRSKTELRFGSKGSVAVDLAKGTWFDHEAGQGGGVLDALKSHMAGIQNDHDAFAWLEQRGLWTNGEARASGTWNGHGGTRQRQGRQRKPIGELIATYDYVDEGGTLLFQVQRFLDRDTGKRDFRQRHKDPATGDWVGNIKNIRRVPYRLPELIEAVGQGHIVFIVEGEKDVDNLRSLGIPATCNPMGAGKWPKMAAELNEHFVDADVVIIMDNDRSGRSHGYEVADSLQQVAARVRLLDLAHFWHDCPHKGDISDWIQARPELMTDSLVNELYAMADELIDFDPEAERPPEGDETADAERPLPPRKATPYEQPDPASIPRRAWLWAGHYIRQAVTATVGPGGYGKTTLAIFEAIRMVAEGLCVWFLSGEDPKVEIDRRIAAHCAAHNVSLKDLPGKLFVDDKTSFPFSIGKASASSRAEVVFDEGALTHFESAIASGLDGRAIDVVILDPFVSFHLVPENDNGCIDQVVKRLALITIRQNCCCEISHHVRKPFMGQRELSVEDSRGGSAIINAVRSGRVINRMTSLEAEEAIRIVREQSKDTSEVTKEQIEKMRTSHIRVDLGKRNMKPAEKATWFTLIDREIANGDHVQALLFYEYPKREQTGLVSDELRAHIRFIMRDKHFRADSKSPDWIGNPIAAKLGLNTEVKKDIMQIQRIIGILKNEKVIYPVELRDAKLRKMRTFYTLSPQPTEEPKADDDNVVPFPNKTDDEHNGDGNGDENGED